MDRTQFEMVEQYMLSCMGDSAHDREHVRRVLHTALVIAGTEPSANLDVLVCACLLHDIGRKEQFETPGLCHAQVGGEKAYRFLVEHGFGEPFANHVRECIAAHRFRENSPPQSLEAKILFDADKLDVAGAIGIARTLLYQGYVSVPLYTRLPNGEISDGTQSREPSFFQEYKYKLENLYDRFYTEKGRAMALARKKTAVSFYEAMLREIRDIHGVGTEAMEAFLSQRD